MKTLKTIQTLAKIGKILSKIVFVFCIVGLCLCVAAVCVLSLGAGTMKVGDVTVDGLIEEHASVNEATVYAGIAVVALFCAAEAVQSKCAERYFRNELADGTPFTLRGAKELLRLGILVIAVSIGTVVGCEIGLGIASGITPNIDRFSAGDYGSVGLGIGMILFSLLCRYGAELKQNG